MKLRDVRLGYWVLGALVLWRWLEQSRDPRSGRVMAIQKDFVNRLGPIARTVEREEGISSFLGMLQLAHESAWGSSGLTQKANNLAGFTAEPDTYWRKEGRPFVMMLTTEWRPKKDAQGKDVVDPVTGKLVMESYKTERPFRAYGSWEESYRDWARLMKTKRYVDAGVLAALKAGDLAAYAAGLQKAGYATDPAYGQKLVRLADQLRRELGA